MSDIDDVRDWVGTEPDDATVQAQLDRFASTEQPAERAALAILLRRQADAGPARWAVSGDYSEDDGAGQKDLANRIAQLRGLLGEAIDTAPLVTVTPMTGPGNLR